MFFTVNQPTVIVASCVHILAALMHLGWDEYSIRTYFVPYRESSFSESSVNVVYTLVQSMKKCKKNHNICSEFSLSFDWAFPMKIHM